MRFTRTVLVEDHAILRGGSRALIEREPDLTVVGLGQSDDSEKEDI